MSVLRCEFLLPPFQLLHMWPDYGMWLGDFNHFFSSQLGAADVDADERRLVVQCMYPVHAFLLLALSKGM
jgi:hypothetical protein